MPNAALAYHAATKYDPSSLGGQPAIDWSAQPLGYRAYDTSAGIALGQFLPITPNPFSDDADPLGGEGPGLGRSLSALSRWLFFTYGVTGIINGQRMTYLRAAPSAGGLYPAELLLVVRDWPELEPGIYGFQPVRHQLIPLWEGPEYADALAAAGWHAAPLEEAGAIAVLGGITARSSWRYRERGYRRVLLDAGHVLGNAQLAAHALGIGQTATTAFHDDAVSACLRESPEGFAPLALIALGVDDPPPRPSWPWLPSPLSSDDEVADTTATEFPFTRRLEAAGRLPARRPVLVARAEAHADEAADRHGWAVADHLGAALSAASPLTNDPLSVLIRRRSCRQYSGAGCARDALGRILAAAYHPATVALGPAVELARHHLRTYLAIRAVEGLEPGVYYLAPAALELRLVKVGDPGETVQHLCLGQELGGAAAFTVFHAADLPRAVAEDGDRCYRLLHLEAGQLGERLNLAAQVEGLGASGIGGFFDDQGTGLLGLPSEHAIVYITTVGVPS